MCKIQKFPNEKEALEPVNKTKRARTGYNSVVEHLSAMYKDPALQKQTKHKATQTKQKILIKGWESADEF